MSNEVGKELVKNLNKKMKDNVAFELEAEDGSISDVNLFIPTGCTELDYIIRNEPGGGIPVGKISTVSGLEATGKSLFAMQVMANAQKMGGFCVYLDTEQGLNTDFAKRVGLDWQNDFVHIKQISCEEVITVINETAELVHKKKKDAKEKKEKPEHEFAIIVWDSIAATPTKLDLESENPDPGSSIAVKPRILSKNMNMLLRNAQRQNIAFLFVNQLRERIGGMPGQDPHVEPGGKAVPFAASVRIRLQSIGKMKDSDGDIFGVQTRAKVIKNRFGPPHRQAEFPIYFSYGIDDEESMVKVLTKHKKVESRPGGRNGTQYKFVGIDGEYNLIEFKRKIRNEPEFRKIADKFMEESLVKNLVDPRNIELEVIVGD